MKGSGMKRKLWSYGLEDDIKDQVDAFDFIFWSLSKQDLEKAIWLEENIEFDTILTRYAMILLADAWEPIKKD